MKNPFSQPPDIFKEYHFLHHYILQTLSESFLKTLSFSFQKK